MSAKQRTSKIFSLDFVIPGIPICKRDTLFDKKRRAKSHSARMNKGKGA